jgi:hypothetical protein
MGQSHWWIIGHEEMLVAVPPVLLGLLGLLLAKETNYPSAPTLSRSHDYRWPPYHHDGILLADFASGNLSWSLNRILDYFRDTMLWCG